MSKDKVLVLAGFRDDDDAWDTFDILSDDLRDYGIRVVMVDIDDPDTVGNILRNTV